MRIDNLKEFRKVTLDYNTTAPSQTLIFLCSMPPHLKVLPLWRGKMYAEMHLQDHCTCTFIQRSSLISKTTQIRWKTKWTLSGYTLRDTKRGTHSPNISTRQGCLDTNQRTIQYQIIELKDYILVFFSNYILHSLMKITLTIHLFPVLKSNRTTNCNLCICINVDIKHTIIIIIIIIIINALWILD